MKTNTLNKNKRLVLKGITFLISLISISDIFQISNIYTMFCINKECDNPPVILLIFFSVSTITFLWLILGKNLKFPIKYLLVLLSMSTISYFLLPNFQDYIIPEYKIVLLFLNISAPIIYLLKIIIKK